MKKLTTDEELKRKYEIEQRRKKREEKQLARRIAYNKKLIEEYPFLRPNRDANYDYSYTMLDIEMPEGWKNAFALQLCAEIKEILVEMGDLDTYEVAQIKEKYGELRWYDNGFPLTKDNVETYKKYIAVLDYYTDLSAHTCVRCGKEATVLTTGWIEPYCDKCAKKGKFKTIPIEKR